jgi:uncharacterized protein YdcH (DUF465 family)
MDVDHHDLGVEFPELSQAIGILSADNPLFMRLFSSYNEITQTIEDIENRSMPVDDYTFESMKMNRVKLKDFLYNMMLAFDSGRKAAADR